MQLNGLSRSCRIGTMILQQSLIATALVFQFSTMAFSQDNASPSGLAVGNQGIDPFALGLRWDVECVMRYDRNDLEPLSIADSAAKYRVLIDFFPNGSLHESQYLIEAEKPERFRPNPFFEAVFDGRWLLQADMREGGGIFLFPKPTMTQSIGVRGNGHFVPLGLSHFQTPNEWNLFNIVANSNGRLSSEKLPNDILRTETETPVGVVTIEKNTVTGHWHRIQIRANKPSDMFYGITLESSKNSSIVQNYSNFVYADPTSGNVLGLVSYAVKQERTFSGGSRLDNSGEIKVIRCELASVPAPDFELPNQLIAEVKEGTPVFVVENPNLQYQWVNGRLVPEVPLEFSFQLSQAVDLIKKNFPLALTNRDWVPSDRPGLCGIFALFSAAEFLNASVPLEKFLNPSFCSASYGSSASELSAAAQQNGLATIMLAGLGIDELRAIKTPSILHVRPRGRADVFSHWIVCFGTNPDGSFRVIDSAFGPESMSMAEMASRFDGTAMLVGLSPSELLVTGKQRFRTRLAFGVSAGLLLVLSVFVVNNVIDHMKSGSQVALLGMIVTSIGVAIVFHGIRPDGLMADRLGVARRLAEASMLTFGEVDCEEILSLVNNPDPKIVLIDTRYADDFVMGTIGEAINYPLNISGPEELELFARLQDKSRIVIFCQSRNCPFSEQIGRRLYSMGLRNIELYKGGMGEWHQRDLE